MNDTNMNEQQLRSEIEDLKRQLAESRKAALRRRRRALFAHRGRGSPAAARHAW